LTVVSTHCHSCKHDGFLVLRGGVGITTVKERDTRVFQTSCKILTNQMMTLNIQLSVSYTSDV